MDYMRRFTRRLTALIYPHGEYRLGSPVDVVDEGSFYRIDGTHIFDKWKIKEIRESDGKIEIVMTDKTVVLVVV